MSAPTLGRKRDRGAERIRTAENVPSASPVVLSYIAGLFDGEGCIHIARSKAKDGRTRYPLHVRIKMCDREPIDLIASIWGGNVLERKRGVWRTAYEWNAAAARAAAFLADIEPYICSAKNVQRVSLALAFQAQKKNVGKDASGEYAAKQAEFHAAMARLNRRGQIVEVGA